METESEERGGKGHAGGSWGKTKAAQLERDVEDAAAKLEQVPWAEL